MKFSSPVVAESHYQGKVHAKNLRLKSVGPQTPSAKSQCVSDAVVLEFREEKKSEFWASLLLVVVSGSSSDPSSSSSSSSGAAPEETSRGFRRRAGRQRRRRGLQPLLLHVPGVVQQPAHGPAALRGQEAQEADDQDEADGDVRPGHGPRSEHTDSPQPPRASGVLIFSCCVAVSSLHPEGLPLHHLQDRAQLCGAVPVSHQWGQTQQPVSPSAHVGRWKCSHFDVFSSIFCVFFFFFQEWRSWAWTRQEAKTQQKRHREATTSAPPQNPSLLLGLTSTLTQMTSSQLGRTSTPLRTHSTQRSTNLPKARLGWPWNYEQPL